MVPTAQAVPTEKSENASRSFSLRQRLSLWLITWAGYLLIRLIGPTLRYTMVPEPGCVTDGSDVPIGIWCFWHRCVIPAGYRFRGRQLAIMVSQSFDGEYIARIVQKLGFRPVRGSSSRGAVGALLGMRNEIELGHSAVFTIDGPRGPRYVAKPGPVMLAKMTGQPITCFYIAVKHAWVLNSWDRMVIPVPFSRACAYGTSPIRVSADATLEEMEALHRQMQADLERCRAQANKILGIESDSPLS
jgi:lysophospholipid acyltransferase (LPLAT)-like uncharacterized protein